MPQPETYRTFIALPLSPDITQKLADVQRTLRRRSPERAVSWVKPANVHVTLFFLGDILPHGEDPSKRHFPSSRETCAPSRLTCKISAHSPMSIARASSG